MKIGIIGTGNIAPAYVKGCANFPEDIQLTTCADLVLERAQLFAARHGLQAQTINGLLANPEIELIINLTIPAAHASVSQQIIAAGKHVYVEKPLALDREAGKAVLDTAEACDQRKKVIAFRDGIPGMWGAYDSVDDFATQGQLHLTQVLLGL